MFELIQLKRTQPEEFLIDNNSPEELSTIVIPDDWWYIKNSYDSYYHKDELKIIELNKTIKPTVKTELPKRNYWDINQGDYRVKEEYKTMHNRAELRKFINKTLLAFTLALTAIAVAAFASVITKI